MHILIKTSTDINSNNRKIIGVPREWLKEGVDKDILENFEKSLERFFRVIRNKFNLISSYIYINNA
jgi:hypothetical protein